MQIEHNDITQHALDKMNIEFLIYQLSQEKKQGITPNEFVIQKIYDWATLHQEKQIKHLMFRKGLVY